VSDLFIPRVDELSKRCRLLYLMSFLDRVNIGTAKLAGDASDIREDALIDGLQD